MTNEKSIIDALKKAKNNAGTQKKLEKKTGVSQSGIANYINGQRPISNMTVGTLLKLFPEMDVSFFQYERPNKKAMNIAKGWGALSFNQKEYLYDKYLEFIQDNMEKQAKATKTVA